MDAAAHGSLRSRARIAAMAPDDIGRIVVGVDGSDGSRRALVWAAEEARLRKSVVVAIHVYTIPPLLMSPDTLAGIPAAPITDPGLIERLEESAEKLLAQEIEQVDSDDLTIEGRVVSGPTADALISAAEEADLVVVGTRGLGGFKELLLGSVSHQVAHYSHCPVVIVPSPPKS
jgi:nucleotide-binding universal stress UspA family protein